MKKLLALLGTLIILVSLSFGQSLTTVTATITDASGQVWIGGTVQAQYLRPQNAQGIVPKSNGVVITESGSSLFAILNSSGLFTLNLADLSTVSPAGGTWQFIICPNTTSFCNNTISTAVIGASVNLSAALSAQVVNPVVTPAAVMPRAYKDAEVAAGPNGMWLDTVTVSIKYRDAFGVIQSVGGAGAVTFSAPPTPGDCTKALDNTHIQDAGFLCVAPSSIPTQVVQNGLIGEYRLTEGTGTTITDSSGSGNTGTFGAGGAAPTWVVPSGLTFSGGQFVSLPAAVNGALTMQFVASFQFAGAGQYNPFISAATGTGTSCNTFMLQNQVNNVNVGTNYEFQTWTSGFRANKRYTLQGEGIVTWTLGGAGNDTLQVNNSNLQTFGPFTTALASNNYQLGGATGGGGVCISPDHFYVGNLYYVVLYNRVLTQAEVNLNNVFLTNTMAGRGQPVALGSTSLVDALVFDGDSEISNVMNGMVTFTSPVNVYNLSAPGFTTLQLVNDAPFAVDPFMQAVNNRPLDLIWTAANDAGGSAQTTINRLNGYCRARRAIGFTCGIMDVMDVSGADTFKNTYDTLVRQYAKTFSDLFIDIGGDYLLGCDGCAGNTTYMSSGLHPTPASARNIVSPYLQRGINRYYGHKDWTSATTYTTGAPAATAITATAEVTNTVTVTTTLNPPVNSCAVITGVTPAGYNNVTNECWNVLTTSPTNFTYFNFVTGLGAGTVFGAVSVPLQQDADMYTILGGSATSPNFSLESCGGYTGQNIYIKNSNTTSPWVLVPFGTETIDGAATLTMPTATSGNNPVVVLQSTLISSTLGGCNWKRVQ